MGLELELLLTSMQIKQMLIFIEMGYTVETSCVLSYSGGSKAIVKDGEM